MNFPLKKHLVVIRESVVYQGLFCDELATLHWVFLGDTGTLKRLTLTGLRAGGFARGTEPKMCHGLVPRTTGDDFCITV